MRREGKHCAKRRKELVNYLLGNDGLVVCAAKSAFARFQSYDAYREPQDVKMEILADLRPESENLADIEATWRLSDKDALHTISEGSAELQKSNLMPPWSYSLKTRQIRCLIGYLRTLGGSR
jgi:hypothetical protein